MRKVLIFSLLFGLALPQNSYAASKSITGEFGQTLTASTTSVANKLGRRFIGYDITDNYCQLAEDRITD